MGGGRAFDALKLEAKPLLVHGAALLQLGELLLVLQVVLLEGCARAARTTRSARARRSNGRARGCAGGGGGGGGAEPGARTALSLLEEQPLLLELAAELLLLGGQRGLDRRQPLQLPAQLLKPLRFLLRALAQRLVRRGDLRELLVGSLQVLCAAAGRGVGRGSVRGELAMACVHPCHRRASADRSVLPCPPPASARSSSGLPPFASLPSPAGAAHRSG